MTNPAALSRSRASSASSLTLVAPEEKRASSPDSQKNYSVGWGETRDAIFLSTLPPASTRLPRHVDLEAGITIPDTSLATRNRRAPRAAIASTVKGKLMQAAPYAAAAASYTAAISIVAAPSLGVYAGAKKEWDEQLRNCPTGVLGHDVLLNEDQPQGARRFDPVNPKSHLKGLIGGSVTGAIIGSAVSVGLVHRSLDNEYALSPALALGGVLCASASSALISFGSKELFVEKYEKTGEIAFDGEPIQKKIPLRCAKSGEVPTSKT